jgi:enterochelin esterase-like enzyme
MKKVLNAQFCLHSGLVCLFGLCVQMLFAQGIPALNSGRVVRLDSLYSEALQEYRRVDVWLPENYNAQQRYPVLYMHDGQMLFDPNTTWNKQSWEVDSVAGALIAAGKLRPFIVVAVWNGGKSRHVDYFPQKPAESLSKVQRDSMYRSVRNSGAAVFQNMQVRSDAYLRFLVRELKPLIDERFATLPDQPNTFIAGSSMGGLISMYAICEYPEIFGGAACLSTHWPGIFTVENNPIPAAFMSYLRWHLPDPRSHKLYFDYGTATLDALYPPLQQQADAIIKARGYRRNSWQTRAFPGAAHTEAAWKKRLHLPLMFLLKP